MKKKWQKQKKEFLTNKILNNDKIIGKIIMNKN